MSWQPGLDQLKPRQAAALALGGPEKVARHTGNGKLTVRQRIAALLDPESFREIGSASGFAHYSADNRLASFTPTNQVMGRGRIEGRPVDRIRQPCRALACDRAVVVRHAAMNPSCRQASRLANILSELRRAPAPCTNQDQRLTRRLA